MSKGIPSNKDLMEMLKRDIDMMKKATKRFDNGEITAKQLGEITKPIGKKARAFNRKVKEAQKALWDKRVTEKGE